MKQKKLALIVLESRSKYYKVATISLSKDGSLHIISHFDEMLKKAGAADQIPTKYTYHPSGLAHFTTGNGKTKAEHFPQIITPHKDINTSVGLMTLGIKGVNLRRTPILDDFSIIKSYKYVFTLRAREYKNIKINFYLASKDFDIKESANKYTEVFQILLPSLLILISTEDEEMEPGIYDSSDPSDF